MAPDNNNSRPLDAHFGAPHLTVQHSPSTSTTLTTTTTTTTSSNTSEQSLLCTTSILNRTVFLQTPGVHQNERPPHTPSMVFHPISTHFHTTPLPYSIPPDDLPAISTRVTPTCEKLSMDVYYGRCRIFRLDVLAGRRRLGRRHVCSPRSREGRG